MDLLDSAGVKFAQNLLGFTVCCHDGIVCFIIATFSLSALNVLTHHDDGQQYELQERLCDPRDDDHNISGCQRSWQGNEGEQGERNRRPHRSHGRRYSLAPPFKGVAETLCDTDVLRVFHGCSLWREPPKGWATARVPTYAHDTLNATIVREKDSQKPKLPTTHVE